jgi:hypothetical protein
VYMRQAYAALPGNVGAAPVKVQIYIAVLGPRLQSRIGVEVHSVVWAFVCIPTEDGGNER